MIYTNCCFAWLYTGIIKISILKMTGKIQPGENPNIIIRWHWLTLLKPHVNSRHLVEDIRAKIRLDRGQIGRKESI